MAAASGRLLKTQKDLATETGLAQRLARLNADEFRKVIVDVGTSLEKAVKTDEQLVHLTFLLVLSRFPKATESDAAIAHLKKAPNRQVGTTDIVWALMNTKEFLGI